MSYISEQVTYLFVSEILCLWDSDPVSIYCRATASFLFSHLPSTKPDHAIIIKLPLSFFRYIVLCQRKAILLLRCGCHRSPNQRFGSMEGGPHVHPVMVPKPTLGDDQVMIEVAAIGLNSNNGLPVYDAVLRLFGRHGSDLYVWNECSGVVVAVGSKVSNFKEGDEVCAIPRHGKYEYPQFVLVPQSHVVQIPSKVTVAAAAALPQASCLSFYVLSILTKATPGKIIMIHGAAGGVGIISLQYARHVGCKVFAVAGTEEKLRLCKTMGAEVCINHKKEDFCKRVKAETGGKGVDIILDVNGGKYFRENLNCLAMGGSLVILGLKGGRIADFDISVLGMKDLTVVGADLINLSFEELGSLLSDVAAIYWPLINAGHITPIIGKTFNFSQVAEALIALRAYRFPGKLLMTSLEI